MTANTPVIEARNLRKTFRLGFRRKKVEALRGVSFAVQTGQIFGFLGPNGAGKTTTIKTIVGLLRPTSGECFLLGQPAGQVAARRRIGYLPESPYFYDNLLPDEFLDLCGRLRRIPRAERRIRAGELIERVGLGHARDRPLRKFSKGMLQRIGLAQSIIGRPDLLILDEPMTGLDPVGRKEIRDLIVELRRQGMTIFFSSHILSDVETLCDRVAIVHRGVVVDQGSLDELLAPAGRFVDIVVQGHPPPLPQDLTEAQVQVFDQDDKVLVTSRGDETLTRTLRWLLDAQVSVLSVIPRRETLENLFLRRAIKTEASKETSPDAREAPALDNNPSAL